MERSLPWPECLKPPWGISATRGMCVLIHTHPKSSLRLTRIAFPWSFVNTLEARPDLTPLAHLTASSSSEKDCTVTTGPKISFWDASWSCLSPETGVGEHAGRRGAVLARVEVAGARDLLRRRLDVGVVEDDHRCLAAEFQVYPFEVVCRRLRDLHAGPDRTCDRDHLWRRVLDYH